VFCFNVLFVYLVVYVICIVLTLPPGGQPICSTMIIIKIIIIIKSSPLARQPFVSPGLPKDFRTI
jgi:hypothetical protein